MTHNVLFALWFFIPAGIANTTPILAVRLPGLRTLSAPLDDGKKFRGKRIFGDHKTWRGLLSGMIAGALIVGIQIILFHHYAWIRRVSSPISYRDLSVLALGLLLGFGALLGDAIESFLKRQWNIAEGHTWFPFDQLDYVIGGLLFSAVYIRLPAVDYAWTVVIWFVMHIVFSYLGYWLKLKERPV